MNQPVTQPVNQTIATIALTRHGETDWNAAKRLQGTSDVPLNDIGRGQASDSMTRFRSANWHGVVTSPLSRAAETGRIIADGLGVALHGTDHELRERHYGHAEGLTEAEAAERWPDGDFPELEHRESVAARGLSAITRIADDHPGSAVIVVAHGTLIREVLRRMTDAPIPAISNAATSIIERVDGTWRVLTVNDQALELEPEAR